jgi:hypothetical protein
MKMVPPPHLGVVEDVALVVSELDEVAVETGTETMGDEGGLATLMLQILCRTLVTRAWVC